MLAQSDSIKRRALYNVFNRFWKAKYAYGGLILSSSQFLLLPEMLKEMKLDLRPSSKKFSQAILR
jgi:hypothetical protein